VLLHIHVNHTHGSSQLRPWYESLLVFLQGMPAVSVLHNALGSPSAPQAAPAPITKAKTFQKAKSLLSFRQQGSTAASFGSSRSSMLTAAYPALPPGDPYKHPVLEFGILVQALGVPILPFPCSLVIVVIMVTHCFLVKHV